jgi:hypothetical protein
MVIIKGNGPLRSRDLPSASTGFPRIEHSVSTVFQKYPQEYSRGRGITTFPRHDVDMSVGFNRRQESQVQSGKACLGIEVVTSS